MILPNLPQKALKTGSVEVKVDSLLAADPFGKGREAALEILPLLNMKFVALDGKPHAPTILSAAAWLTGTSLYHALQDRNISSRAKAVMPQDVNREWESLVYLLEQYVFQRADIPVGRIVLAAMAAQHFFKPQFDLTYVQSELQEQYSMVMKKHGFNRLECVHVGVILCSILIQQYSRAGMVDTDAATGVVAQEIFQAARQDILP